jgi:hypothetical protein
MQLNQVSVLWTTSQAGSGSVTAVARDGSSVTAHATMQVFLPSTTQLASTFYQYQAEITGLKAGTEYIYSVAVQ